MGRIVDVLVDGPAARAAIIDFGGFCVGSRNAVEWKALHLCRPEKRYGVVLELTRDR